MAAKPTETLAFEPTTAAVAVPSTKQAAGFQPGETPPAQYFNWLFRTFSRLYNYVVDGNFTGNHTITGTLGVAGLITASAGAAAASGQHLTTSGSGAHRHGDHGLQTHGLRGAYLSGWSPIAVSGYHKALGSTAAAVMTLSVPLNVGDRIRSVAFQCAGDGAADVSVTVLLQSSAATETSIGTLTVTNPSSTYAVQTIDVTDTEIATGQSILIGFSASAANIAIATVSVTYDRPATAVV